MPNTFLDYRSLLDAEKRQPRRSYGPFVYDALRNPDCLTAIEPFMANGGVEGIKAHDHGRVIALVREYDETGVLKDAPSGKWWRHVGIFYKKLGVRYERGRITGLLANQSVT